MEHRLSMSKYEKVRLVVCDNQSRSTSLKSSLNSLGISNVKTCGSAEGMAEALEDGLIDLLLYDYDSVGDSLLTMTQKIRRKYHGRNPFVIVIATVTTSDMSTIRPILDSGIDYMIRKPFNDDKLFNSIEKFTKSRKPFATSYNYLGPTRRSADRDNADSQSLFHVPNTLQAKVVRNMTEDELQRIVDIALFELEDKHLEAHAKTINQMTAKVIQACNDSEQNAQVPELLIQTKNIVQSLLEQLNETLSPQIANLAKMLFSLITRIQLKSPDKLSTDLELMSKLALAIYRALTVERDAIELMQEIVETVATSVRTPT
jgi:CheY-like chemotaxis protein